MNKKIISLLLCAATVFSFTGCGNTNSSKSNKDSTSNSQVSSASKDNDKKDNDKKDADNAKEEKKELVLVDDEFAKIMDLCQ